MKKLQPVLPLLLLLLLGALPARAAGLAWYTEDLPPFNYLGENGHLTGAVTEILAHVCAGAGVPFDPAQVEILPWTRAYQHALRTPGAAVFSMARTPEREHLFKWVGPLCTVRYGLVAKKAHALPKGLGSFPGGLIVGTVRDSAPEEMLAQQGFPAERIERTPYRVSCARMLATGRIQAWAFNVPTALHTLRETGEDPADYEDVGFLGEMGFYLAFNRDTDDSVVQRLQAALDEFRKTPRYRSILDAHLLRGGQFFATRQQK